MKRHLVCIILFVGMCACQRSFCVEWAPEDAYIRACVGGRITRKGPPPRDVSAVDKSVFVFVKRSLERLQASVKSVSFHLQLADILIKLSVQIKRIEPCFRSDWTSGSTRRKKTRRRRRLEHDLIELFQECQFFFLLSIVFSQ